jgi:hypothetical protein
MTSETIYKRYTASCLQCRSEISMQNFSKHLDSKQCKKGGKAVYGLRSLRNSLNCIHCDKLCNTINSLAQHEIRCKSNPDKISVAYLRDRELKSHAISPTPCPFCDKIFITKNGLNNHTTRCKITLIENYRLYQQKVNLQARTSMPNGSQYIMQTKLIGTRLVTE